MFEKIFLSAVSYLEKNPQVVQRIVTLGLQAVEHIVQTKLTGAAAVTK